jgi:hypothetical protein
MQKRWAAISIKISIKERNSSANADFNTDNGKQSTDNFFKMKTILRKSPLDLVLKHRESKSCVRL